jgi:hypothetical protein
LGAVNACRAAHRAPERTRAHRHVAPMPPRGPPPPPPRWSCIPRATRPLSRTRARVACLGARVPPCGTPKRARRQSSAAPPAGHGLHALPAVESPISSSVASRRSALSTLLCLPAPITPLAYTGAPPPPLPVPTPSCLPAHSWRQPTTSSPYPNTQWSSSRRTLP